MDGYGQAKIPKALTQKRPFERCNTGLKLFSPKQYQPIGVCF
jgi:hypothetical protein